MNDIIKYNPFRILKIYTDTVITSEMSVKRLSLYHGFYDFAMLKKRLGILQITYDLYEDADKLIQNSSDRIGYAMFWFMKGDDSIEMESAMGDLTLFENFDSAMSKLSCIDTTASRVNRSVICLIDKKLSDGVALMNEVLSDNQLRKEFVEAVSDKPYAATKEDLMKQYLRLLCCQFNVDDVRAAVSNLPEMRMTFQQLLDDKVIDEIEKAKQVQEAVRKAQEVDPSICFFCGEPTRNMEDYKFENKTYKNSKIVSGVIETTKTITINIPTCASCKKAMERKSQWGGVLTLVFTIILFVVFFIIAYRYLEMGFFPTLFVVVLPDSILAPLLGYLLALLFTPILMMIFDRKHCRKFKHHIEDHPKVAQLLREGYKQK